MVEADESDASFLNLNPILSVVTNIDADHMETYGHDFARLKAAFVDFVHRMPFYGAAILCADDPGVRSIIPMISRPVVTYGLDEGVMVRAVDVQALPGGQMRFIAQRRNGAPMPDLQITLNLPGEHNVRNALAALAVATELELPDEPMVSALAAFSGVGRRFQRYGELRGARRRGRSRWSTTTATTRWRWRRCSPRRAAPFPAGAWCWPSSRTATRARATASRTSSRSWARPTRCC